MNAIYPSLAYLLNVISLHNQNTFARITLSWRSSGYPSQILFHMFGHWRIMLL